MFILIAILVIIFLSLIKKCIRPKNYPNGPIFLPIIGSAWSVPPKGIEYKIPKWKRKYGNLIGHKLGSADMVIISGSKEIIEALKHPNFQGRYTSAFFTQRSFFKPLGFFFADNETWSEVRRFSLRYFGQVFNTCLETLLNEELREHFARIRSGEIADIDGPFMTLALNVILKLLTGVSAKEYPHAVEDMRNKTEIAFKAGRVTGIEVVYPSLRRFFHNDIVEASFLAIQTFFKERLEEHKSTFNSLDIKDYTDAFLLEREKEINSKGSVEHYTDAEYIACTLDMVQAGAESTGKTIEFVLLYVSLNLQVQDKIHQEIDRILGKNRIPTLNDRPDLPYVEATIYEAMRINTIAPIGVLHRVTEKTNFRGFTFKKDTILLYALKDYMNDPEIWDRPDEFIPDRFLDKDRKTKKIPNFGLGKRSCIGEVLVKNFIFLYIANFFQKYSIKLPSGYKPSTKPILGFTNGPKPFKLIITERT